jgi:hypothetical protein
MAAAATPRAAHDVDALRRAAALLEAAAQARSPPGPAVPV